MKKSSLLNIFSKSGFIAFKNNDFALSNKSCKTSEADYANIIFYGFLSYITGKIISIHYFVRLITQ